MADKQIDRPIEPEVSWANDATHNDPGEPWDGLANKVDPGSGKRDDGWLPNEDVDAEHLNRVLNEIGRWVQYLSDIQITNWQNLGEPHSENISGPFDLIYDEGDHQFYSCGGTNDLWRSADGVEWELRAVLTLGVDPTTLATKRPEYATTHTGNRILISSRFTANVNELQNDTVNSITKANANDRMHDALWHVNSSQWITCGEDSGTPTVWRTPTPITAGTFHSLTNTNSSVAQYIAADPGATGTIVIVGDSTDPDIWTSTNGTSFVQQTPTGLPAGDAVIGLGFDSIRGIFVVLLLNGGVATSTDGIAWTVISTLAGPLNFKQDGNITIGGGFWVALSDDGPDLFYSSDGGNSWRIVYHSITGQPASNIQINSVTYSRPRGQFLAYWEGLENFIPPQVLRSLACATSLYSANSDSISLPTVT